MPPMTQDALDLLKWEYHESKVDKEGKLHGKWKELVDEFRGDATKMFETIEQSVANPTLAKLIASDGRMPNVNLIIRKLIALLTLKDIEFNIKNRTPNFEAMADLLEYSVEQVLQDINIKKLNRKTLLDALLFGTAAWSIGYESIYVPSERAWAEPIPRGMDSEDVKHAKKLPHGALTEYGLREVGKEMPTIHRIRPHDLFFPPGTVVLEEVRRIYVRHTRWASDVWRDSRYSKKFRRQFRGKPTDKIKGSYPAGNALDIMREVEKGEVIQCFDIASNQFCVFSEDADVPAIDWTPQPFKFKGLPIKIWTPIEDPESVWGIPYAWLFLPQARAINQLRAKEILSLQRDGKKVFVWNPELVDQDELDQKVLEARDGAHITFDKNTDTGLDMRKMMQTIDFGGANKYLGEAKDAAQRDLGMISGLDDPARNEPGKSRTTATEIDARRTQQGVTFNDIQMMFEEYQEEGIGDLIMVILQNWGQERMIKVVGKDTRVWFWVKVERDKMLAEFTLKITAGSTQKQDKTVYRQQLIEAIPKVLELGQHIDQERLMVAQGMEPSPVDREALLRLFLEELNPRLADVVMRRKDPAELVMRLIQQHDLFPDQMSPILKQQVDRLWERQKNPPALPAPGQALQLPTNGGVSFEERTGNPGPADVANDTLLQSGGTARVLSNVQGAAQ